MATKNIMIGVLDYTSQKDARTSYESNNSACYYGNTGNMYGMGGAVQGTGFN
jgi:hypothetical protein